MIKKKPKTPKKFKLDTSMSEDEAKSQKIIADSKQSMRKADLLELKFLESKGNLIEVEVITNIIHEVFTKLKSSLYAVSKDVPSQVLGKSHTEITDILYKFIDNSLERFSNDFQIKIENIKVKDGGDDE